MTDPAHSAGISWPPPADEFLLIARIDAVQHLLALLDPRPDDAHVGYIALVQRARNALSKELQQLGLDQYA